MKETEWEEHFRTLADTGAPEHGPDAVVAEVVSQFASPSAKASRRGLDLACGAGANCLWLAERGWEVTAVDRSPSAMELVRAGAARRGVNIETRVADLDAHEFAISPGAWDLILMCRYLQRDLWEPARLGLAPRGVLIVIALLDDASSGDSRPRRFRVQPGELGNHFGSLRGWTVLHHREGTTAQHRVSEIAVRRDEIPLE
jgi:tellurite methyltransferase